MRIKPKEIDFETTIAKSVDKLDRYKTAASLVDIVKVATEPLVLAVTGKWGYGKTFFCHLMNDEMKEKGLSTVYFNAWENDFYREPLPAIIAEIGTLFPKEDAALVQLKSIGISLLKSGVPQLIKALTAGVLDLKGVFEEVVSEAASNYFEKRIEEYSETKENIRSFKDKLRQLIEDNGNRKVVIIVDELDRCRPLFAVELLETIKHLFAVEGLSFILSIDQDQIYSSIRKLYGQDIDVHGYLSRFIDIYYPVPEPNINAYCTYLFERYDYSEFFTERQKKGINDKGEFIDAISEISKVYKLSLRDIEKVFTRMTLVFMTTEHKYFLFPYILVFLLVVFYKDKELYEKIVNKKIDLKGFIDYLSTMKDAQSFIFEDDSYAGQILCGNMAVFLADDRKGNAYEYLEGIISDESKDPKLRRWAESVKMMGQETRNGRPFIGMMKYLKDKIDIVGQLQN